MTTIKKIDLDSCDTIADAYLMLKLERVPCYGVFNEMYLYSNVNRPPHLEMSETLR